MPPLIPTAGRVLSGGFSIAGGGVGGLYQPYYKIVLTDKNGVQTTYQNDANDRVISWEVLGRQNALKQAKIVLFNNDGKWSNKFAGGENVQVFADYTNTLGTPSLIFKGKIDQKYFDMQNGEITLMLTCRQTPQFEDKTILRSFTATDAGTAASTIISENYSGIVNTTNLTTIGTTVTLDFNHDTGSSAMNKIVDAIQYYWYIDESDNLNMPAPNSQVNTTERVGLGTNVIAVSQLGKDTKDIKNRAYVYGLSSQSNSDIYYLQTREDSASQTQFWIKDSVTSDTSIKNGDNAGNLATKSLVTTTLTKGQITIVGGLLTLQVGQLIDVQLPYMELQGKISVADFRHSWNNQGLNTTISISQTQDNLARLFRERIKVDNALRDIRNKNSMKISTFFDFTTGADTSSQTNTQLTGGTIQLTSGSSNGIWLCALKTLNATATSFELRVDGADIGTTTYQVSLDGGVTFATILPSVVTTSLSGKQLQVKITMVSDTNNVTPIIRALSVLTK